MRSIPPRSNSRCDQFVLPPVRTGGPAFGRCTRYKEFVSLETLSEQDAEKLRDKTVEYHGRSCRNCQYNPRRAQSLPETPQAELSKVLDLRTATSSKTRDCQKEKSNRSTKLGIITGGSKLHWPCIGAIALASEEYDLGCAVADHGLENYQVQELERIGVQIVGHNKPDLKIAKEYQKARNDVKAWWKPWVCAASPFDVALWIDADAVLVGDPRPLLTLAEKEPQISTQTLWQEDSAKLYRSLVAEVFPNVQDDWSQLAQLNSGVLAWHRGDTLIQEWQEWCNRMIQDGPLSRKTRMRDQSALLLTLVDRMRRGAPLPQILPDEWNVPADYLASSQSKNRQPVPLSPCDLLDVTRERHPNAKVVHWLGGIKPWSIQQ